MPARGREEIECPLEHAAPLIQINSDEKPVHAQPNGGYLGAVGLFVLF